MVDVSSRSSPQPRHLPDASLHRQITASPKAFWDRVEEHPKSQPEHGSAGYYLSQPYELTLNFITGANQKRSFFLRQAGIPEQLGEQTANAFIRRIGYAGYTGVLCAARHPDRGHAGFFLAVPSCGAGRRFHEAGLRCWGGGRESSFVYHWAKRSAMPLLVLSWVIYLALPFSLHPTFIVLPFATFLLSALP